MSWWFLLPLAIALLIASIFRSSLEDIRYLADSGVLLNLLLSLILAPWQVKIVLLLVILWRSRELLRTLNPVADGEEQVSLSSSSLTSSNIKSELKKKIPHQPSPKTPSTSTKVTLPDHIKYRGL